MIFKMANAVVLTYNKRAFFEKGEDFGVLYKVKSTYET